jgi:hypothetical protein
LGDFNFSLILLNDLFDHRVSFFFCWGRFDINILLALFFWLNSPNEDGYLFNFLLFFSFSFSFSFVCILLLSLDCFFSKLGDLYILLLLISVLTILISKKNTEWYLFFYIPINITIISDIIYNIIILIYLTFRFEQKKNENSRISERIDLRKSIEFEKYSFIFIHIISICLGLVHSVILILFRDKNDFTINSFSNWFYFFCPIEASIPTVFIFTPF